MYSTLDISDEYEPVGSTVTTAFAPDALISVGALSVTMAALVVLCHLYATFGPRRGRTLFEANDKFILVYFYAVICVFAAVAVF